MYIWAMRGWKKGDNKTPENLDLIQAYYEYEREGYHINLKKIKGHSGDKWNDMADALATGKLKPTYEWRPYGE